MSFTDDARSDEQRIESAEQLSEIIRLRKVRAAIRAATEKHRDAGKPEPRTLGG